MRAARTAPILLGVAVAALATAPASASFADDPPRAQAGAKKKKPKPVTCKPGQLRVTLGKRVSCRKLRKPAAQRDPQVAVLLGVVQRDLSLKTRSGRRIAPLWSIGGGRLKAVRARLVRALPKALAFQTSRARAGVNGDPTACADLARVPAQTSSFDGFSVSVAANGAVEMSVTATSGYRIEVTIDSRATCSNLDLKACPDPDGTLDGNDSHRSILGLRVTKDGAIVQSVRTTVRSTQKLKGKVADDAKLDTVNLEDVARQSTQVEIPGASVSVSLSILRTAELDMRGGATRNAQVRVGVGGFSAADAGRIADDYARSFPDLIREEREAYKRRENAWQSPGSCAKLTFDPASGTRPVQKGESGTVTAKIEANAGGLATKARWTASGAENGTFSPVATPAGSQSISYQVTGEPGRRLTAKYRVTSTAGVDEKQWSQEIEDRVRYYRVTALEYTDQLALDGLPAVGGCTPSTSQTNTTTFVPSGAAYDGAIGPTGPPGTPLRGSIIGHGQVTKTAAFSGCKLNDDASAWVSCPLLRGGSDPIAVSIDVQVPASGDAQAALQVVGLIIGEVPPAIDPCVIFGTQVAFEARATDSVPAAAFAGATPQTLSFDVPANAPAPGGGTLHSVAHYAMTVVRVSADGSPYTG